MLHLLPGRVGTAARGAFADAEPASVAPPELRRLGTDFNCRMSDSTCV